LVSLLAGIINDEPVQGAANHILYEYFRLKGKEGISEAAQKEEDR
jgi:hypothetical protein